MQDSQLNIWPISKLSSFKKKYPNQELHEYIEQLSQSFPYHRIVKGDGNCFYRAFAFLYLAYSPCDNFRRLLPKIDWVCTNSPNKQYEKKKDVFQNQLQKIWSTYIKPMSAEKSREKKQKKLEILFNTVENFDNIMVGYFRSLNYHNLVEQKKKFFSFAGSQQQFQNQLKRVAIFGSESSGIQINSLAQATNSKLIICVIGKNGFYPEQYNEGEDKGFCLFFRPGHYDIIYQNVDENKGNTFYKRQSMKTEMGEQQVETPTGEIVTKSQKSNIKNSKLVLDPLKQRSSQGIANSQSIISSQGISSPDRSSSPSRLQKKTTNYYTTYSVPVFAKYDVRYRNTTPLQDFKNSNIVESRMRKQQQEAAKKNLKAIEKYKVQRKVNVISSGLNLSQKIYTELFGLLCLSALGYAVYAYYL